MKLSERKEIRSAMLVYQHGIANVFGLTGDGQRKRLLQHAFTPCEYFAKGLAASGVPVSIHHCDKAGDIIGAEWESGPGEMFRDGKHFTYNAVQVRA